MKVLRNKLFVILALLFTVCLMAVSTTFISTAKADTSAPPTLTMIEGASVRVDGTEVNGLRFAAGMSESDYDWFSENVGAGKTYKDVQFGMFIAPANYLSDYADFDLGTLFGDKNEKVMYDWAEWNADTQEWEYDGENGANETPVRIINIKKSTLKEYKGQMAIIGAISDYKEWNIVKNFVGLGYYQLTDTDDVVTNYLATYAEENKANNTRSMIEVVQTAMEDGTLVPEQVDQAKATYFDTIAEHVSVKNAKIEVVGNKTVVGDDYNGAMNSKDISDVVYTYDGKATEFKLNDWTTGTNKIAVDGSVVKGVSMTTGSIVISKYIENLTVAVDVYTPISTRADLDALGFDYYEDGSVEKWATGNRYMLTNDIDYATDTSVYNSAEKGNMRMSDGNDTVDLWDRYLIPIAATQRDISGTITANADKTCQSEWGIFGQIGGDGKFFYGIIDGAGFAIKNAVIPYGVSFSYDPSVTGNITNHASNFIGTLVYGGQLRNIAFTDLEFEDYTQVGAASKTSNPNPYYTTANTNIEEDSLLATKGAYMTQDIMKGTWGSEYFNPSNLTGLVGAMQNGIISNVYVDAVMKFGTFGQRAINGLIVSIIDADHVPNGTPQGGIYSKVENCITKTSYYANAQWMDWLVNRINMSFAQFNSYNSGMGAVVGTSFLTDPNAINNCFAIADLKVSVDKDRAIYNPITTIFSPGTVTGTGGRHSSVAGLDLSTTNCGIYASATALHDAHASVLESMSIAKYLGLQLD